MGHGADGGGAGARRVRIAGAGLALAVTAHDGGIATSLVGQHVTWYGDPSGRAGLLVAVVNEDGKIVTKDADKVIIDGHA